MKWMVWIIPLLSEGRGILAGLQAVLLQHSLVLLVWRNKGLQSWNAKPATHQRTGLHRIWWEDRSRVSGTGKRGIIKKSYFCFNCIFCSWNLFHTPCCFRAMFTYLGFPEACTVCLLEIMSICVPVAHLICASELPRDQSCIYQNWREAMLDWVQIPWVCSYTIGSKCLACFAAIPSICCTAYAGGTWHWIRLCCIYFIANNASWFRERC